MNNETDLDWLARNVHVWSEGANYVCVNHTDGGYVFHEHNRNCAIWFTKDQWLARRAGLQNKPSWKDAPEWGEWLAQDEDGEWKWLAGLPGKYVDGWTAVKIKDCCKGSALGDWRDTLEKRPEQDEFEAFTSIEDNQEKGMTQQQEVKQDNGWFERGELPPAGGRCVLHAAENNGEEVMFIGVTSDSCPVFETARKRVFVERGEYKFTPIRNERDVLADLIESHGQMSALTVADAIIAAGFKLEAK